MQQTPISPFWASAVVAMAFVLGGTVLWAFFMPGSGPPASPDLAYYRAVYVLRQFGGTAAAEPEEMPASGIRNDDTESLLHHPDRIFVLRYLADELAGFAESRPKARLFEAYARLSLGEKREAADLLTRYVCDSPYQAGHYALLCSVLQDLREYESLLLMCREWGERDAVCLSGRSIYAWVALCGLQRFREAGTFMEGERSCVGWQSRVYAARAYWALGQEEKAQSLLAQAENEASANRAAVDRMWRLLAIQPSPR